MFSKMVRKWCIFALRRQEGKNQPLSFQRFDLLFFCMTCEEFQPEIRIVDGLSIQKNYVTYVRKKKIKKKRIKQSVKFFLRFKLKQPNSVQFSMYFFDTVLKRNYKS